MPIPINVPPYVDQLALFASSRDGTEASFWKFHEANPQVYEGLVNLCRRAKSRGIRRAGIKMLFEVLRWQTALRTRDETNLKLNNNYHSRYARLIMSSNTCSEACFGCDKLDCYAGLFSLRELAQSTTIDTMAAG